MCVTFRERYNCPELVICGSARHNSDMVLPRSRETSICCDRFIKIGDLPSLVEFNQLNNTLPRTATSVLSYACIFLLDVK